MYPNLRVDASTMYEYTEGPNSLNLIYVPSNVEIKLDTLPIAYPYVPRLCKQQGYFIIWYGSPDDNQDILDQCIAVKNEKMWACCDSLDRVDLSLALVYPYENEVIIGTVKYPGYMKNRTKSQRTTVIRNTWADLIKMFSDRTIICPSGTYFDCLHLAINQQRASHEPYHKRIMSINGFKREGEMWIRKPHVG